MIFHKVEKPPRRKTPTVDRKHPKFKVYRCRMDTPVPIREETPINSFPILEEAIKFAEEDGEDWKSN